MLCEVFDYSDEDMQLKLCKFFGEVMGSKMNLKEIIVIRGFFHEENMEI